MVNQAASGDIIDLSTMSCDSITLSGGALIVPQDSLTLTGKSRFYGLLPGTFIHGVVRVIDHTGTDTLNLVNISDDHVATPGMGPCILSSGLGF